MHALTVTEFGVFLSFLFGTFLFRKKINTPLIPQMNLLPVILALVVTETENFCSIKTLST